MKLEIRLVTEDADKRRCETIMGCSRWMLHPADGNAVGYKNLAKWLKHFTMNEVEQYNDVLDFIARVALNKQPVEITMYQYEWINRIYTYVWDEIIDPTFTRHHK